MGQYGRRAQKAFLILRAAQQLVEKYGKDQNDHRKLKKHAQLITAAFEAFDEDKLIHDQSPPHHPVNNRIAQMQAECLSFPLVNISGQSLNQGLNSTG